MVVEAVIPRRRSRDRAVSATRRLSADAIDFFAYPLIARLGCHRSSVSSSGDGGVAGIGIERDRRLRRRWPAGAARRGRLSADSPERAEHAGWRGVGFGRHGGIACRTSLGGDRFAWPSGLAARAVTPCEPGATALAGRQTAKKDRDLPVPISPVRRCFLRGGLPGRSFSAGDIVNR